MVAGGLRVARSAFSSVPMAPSRPESALVRPMEPRGGPTTRRRVPADSRAVSDPAMDAAFPEASTGRYTRARGGRRVDPGASAWGGSTIRSAPRPALRESRGAIVGPASFDSASARTSGSVATGPRSSVGEAQAYIHAVVERPEYGLERPGVTSRGGRGDFITVVFDGQGRASVIVTDVKTVSSDRSRPPAPATSVPPAWRQQVADATSPARLDLGDPALNTAVREAVRSERVFLRQIDVDLRTEVIDGDRRIGGGTMTGWDRLTPIRMGDP